MLMVEFLYFRSFISFKEDNELCDKFHGYDKNTENRRSECMKEYVLSELHTISQQRMAIAEVQERPYCKSR